MAFILYGRKMDLETCFAYFKAKNNLSPLCYATIIFKNILNYAIKRYLCKVIDLHKDNNIDKRFIMYIIFFKYIFLYIP